jgi:hypothetical protein
MRLRLRAQLAAAWGIVFAAPHVYWATGRKEGLGTALSDRVVRDAGLAMALSCAGIALFCLCGAAVALATVREWPPRWQAAVRRALVGLTWFGAVLLILRSLDIFVEFSAILTRLWSLPGGDWPNYLHLARWFMFVYLPWFVLGAIVWTRLAWHYTRAGQHASLRAEPATAG